MSRNAKIAVFIVGVILAILGFVNFFIYPFQSDNPNFSDVERVFNRIQIPSNWTQIDSSENRGRFGRTCPIESSGCFNKTATFKVEKDINKEEISKLLITSGCESVAFEANTPIGGVPYDVFRCSTVEEVNVSATLNKGEQDWNLGIIAGSN